MSQIFGRIGEATHSQLLYTLVSGSEHLLDNIRFTNRELFRELLEEAVASKEGWEPLKGGEASPLLLKLFPNFQECLDRAKLENPELVNEIERRNKSREGWKPLHWWRGCL